MKMYLLDNNVLSELWKHSPDPKVEAWFASKPEWFLPVPVIAEIQEGAEATGSATRKGANQCEARRVPSSPQCVGAALGRRYRTDLGTA